MTDELVKGYLSVREAAKYLGVSRQRVYDLLKVYPPKDTKQTFYGLLVSKADVDVIAARHVRIGRPTKARV